MTADQDRRRSKRNQQMEMVAAAIRHPIRVRALEWMNNRVRGDGRELSATVFVHQGLGREIAELKDLLPGDQVSLVSYHLKELEKAGATYETRWVQRRGGKERFYRANTVAYFSDEAWAAIPLERRRGISRVMAQGLVVQIEGAIYNGIFDSRTDRWFLWEPKELDDQAFSEMATALGAFHAEAKQIEREAEKRLKVQGKDAEPIPTTFALLMFQSPELPDLPDEDGDAPGD